MLSELERKSSQQPSSARLLLSHAGDPSIIRELTAQQQVLLTEILDQYLSGLELGQAPERMELIARHPEIASALAVYLQKLDELHSIVGRTGTVGSNLAGKRLGDFELTREIGRGGMGVVYAANQLSLRREVAVKLLPGTTLLNERVIERFRNEARAAAQLEHPNIVPVYSVGDEGGVHYYAMKLIEGHSLDQRIAIHLKNGSRVPWISAVKQFAQVAEALHYAHEDGIIHRDIKPSNLIIDLDGKLWVADFGLARIQSDVPLTQTGEMLGTMRYMSPEQATGSTVQVDNRTDIYSLGVTLYEFLTLQPAILGDEGPGMLRLVESAIPVRFRKLRRDSPRSLQIVLDRAMAKRKEDRYQTAREFADDLHRLAAGQPIAIKPLSPIVVGFRWAAEHSRFVVALSMLLILATTWLAVSTVRIRYERDRAESNLLSAHNTVNEFGSKLIDDLAEIPNAEAIRRDVAARTLRYYQAFVEQSNDNPKLVASLAETFTRMGNLAEELGQLPQAIEYCRKAEDIYRKLPSLIGDDQVRRARDQNRNQLALALERTENGVEGIDLLDKTLKEQRVRLATNGPEVGPLSDVGITENNYGLLLLKGNRRKEAERVLEQAIEHLTEALELAPEMTEVSRALSASYHNLGTLKADYEIDSGIDCLNKSVAIQLRLAGDSQNRLRVSKDLVTSYIALGTAYLSAEDETNAVESFENAEKIAAQLVAISPSSSNARRELALSRCNLGLALARVGEHERSIASLMEAVASYQSILKQYPDSISMTTELVITQNNLAQVYEQTGERNEAEEAFFAAETFASAIAEKAMAGQLSAEVIRLLNVLVKVYANHGRLELAAGRMDSAKLLAEKRNELLILLKSQNTDRPNSNPPVLGQTKPVSNDDLQAKGHGNLPNIDAILNQSTEE